MDEPTTQEGTAPFAVPSIDTPCHTSYKIFGDVKCGVPPLIVLHGGPGSGHEYMIPFAHLWKRYGLPIVFYDQIGCAASTHLQQKAGDHSFWQVSLFVTEFHNLIEHLGIEDYHILGHSWGGVVAVAIAARQPPGLRRLILAGASADSQLMVKGLWKLKETLSPEAQKAIEEAVDKTDFTSQAYRDAAGEFSRTYFCRSDPFPPREFVADTANQAQDSTVRVSLLGPSPWLRNGSLKTYSSIPLLSQINVPTLVYHGEFDTSQYATTVPFFNHIPKVRWVTLSGASHMSHLDSAEMQEKTLALVGDFLNPKQH